jgi:hypothetical protein
MIRTTDMIMEAEQRDMLFIEFHTVPPDYYRFDEKIIRRHRRWFKTQGLRTEMTAPPGWLEGRSGIEAVFFDGLNDARIAAYSALFEDASGTSLEPDKYQMKILMFDTWKRSVADRPEIDDDI